MKFLSVLCAQCTVFIAALLYCYAELCHQSKHILLSRVIDYGLLPQQER
jgi:hypothetical protein